MTPDQAAQIKRAIRQLVRAEVAYSWIGSAPACDHEIIESERKAALARVSQLVARVTVKGEPK